MAGVASSSDVFRAVADPTRRALLDLLRKQDRCVMELAQPFHMTQPAISQHLRVLREAGLILARPQGRQRLYRLNPEPIEEVYRWVAGYRRFVDPMGHVWGLAAAWDSSPPAAETRGTLRRRGTGPKAGPDSGRGRAAGKSRGSPRRYRRMP